MCVCNLVEYLFHHPILHLHDLLSELCVCVCVCRCVSVSVCMQVSESKSTLEISNVFLVRERDIYVCITCTCVNALHFTYVLQMAYFPRCTWPGSSHVVFEGCKENWN